MAVVPISACVAAGAAITASRPGPTGDDGNVGNGSERMPAISPCGNFTSFVGDDYGVRHVGQRSERNVRSTVELCGDMGLGIQIKDVSFIEDLTHTLRIARWAGTNSPAMIKYLTSTEARATA